MFALAAANTTGSLFTMILIYAVIIGGFWFLLMRPQKKEQKRVAAMIAEMEVGDTVLTTSGFYGVIIDITEDDVIVEFGSNKNCRIPDVYKRQINQLTKEYESLDTGLNSYMEGVSGIQSSYDTLNAALGQAAAGADALAEGAGNLAAGNVSLSSGASGLIVGTQKLQAGASEVVDGLSELKDGTGELLDGTGEFSEQVSGIDEKIEEEIDKAVEMCIRDRNSECRA